MSKGLKGITVMIDGDARPLNQTLSKVNAESKSLQGELKGVNSLLKFDPKNTELLAQKQTVLTQAIEQTESKLKTLTQAQQEMAAAGKNADNSAEYRDLQREIAATQQKLAGYNTELKNTQTQQKQAGKEAETLGQKIYKIASHIPVVNKLADGFVKTKQKITETVKESEAVKKIGTAVEGAKQKVEAFKDAHPAVKKVADAFHSVKEKADELKSKLPSMKQTLAAVGSAAQTAASGGFNVLSTMVGGTTKAFVGFTTAAAGAGVAAIKVGKEFESSMSQVAATMGITRDTVLEDGSKPYEILATAAKDAGKSTAFSASQAAEALNYLALAGYDAGTAAEVLPSVLNLAAAGGMDLAYASDLATDAMSALGIEASNENLTNFGDKLAVTAQKSNTSVSQLGEAILTVGATAKDLAGGTTELNTELGILADSGIKGAEGGTHLRNVILSLQNPTDAGAAALQKYTNGVYDAEGSMRPLNEVLGELNGNLSAMSQQEKSEVLNSIFNKTDLAAAKVLLTGCAGGATDLAAAFGETAVDLTTFNANMEKAADICLQTTADEAELEAQLDEGTITLDEFNAQYDTLYDKAYNALGPLKDMGLSMSDIENAIGSGDQLYLYASAINGISDEAEKAKYAQAVFGDSVTDMEPLLKSGITDMDTMKAHAKDLGLEIESSGSRFNQLSGYIDGADGAMQSMADTMNDNLKGQVTILKSGLEGLGVSIYEKLQDPLKDVAVEAQGIVEQLQNAFDEGGFEGMIEGIGSVISSLVTSLSSVIPSLIDKILPPLINGFFTLVKAVTATLPSLLPMILNAAITLFSGILQGLNETVPQIMEMLPTLIQTLSQTLIANLPQLVTAGVQILAGLISGITQTIPTLIDAIIGLIPVIVQTVMENLPLIIMAGLDLLLALANGIVQAIPQLIEMLPTIIDSIVTNIVTMLPQIIETGTQLLNAIVSGIIQAIPQLIAALPQIISSTVNTIIANLPKIIQTGIELIGALISGIIQAIPALLAALPKVFTAIINAFKGINWADLGKNIIDGVIEGVKNAADSLINVFKDMAKSALDAVKDFFKIKSPSQVMRDQVGKMLPAGMAQGVEDGMDEEEKRIKAAMARGIPTTIDGFIKSGGSRTSSESTWTAGGGDFVQNLTINSPRELSPSETARLNRNAMRMTVLRIKQA